MKTLKYLHGLLALMLCVLLVSCDEEGNDDFVPQTYNVSGKVEKGPFVSGSAITVQPMSAQMQALGTMYTSTIQDHLGNFSFGSKLFESPYAELTANGYFFNEVTGALSSGTLYLRAIVDLSKSATVNVNILTHIKYQRVLNLIAQGKTYASANEQAQEELFAAFGLQTYADKDASQYSIIEGTEESAALIAISSLILVDRTEAAVTEYLARLCREFGENGMFSNETRALISADREKIADELSNIRENIKERYNDLGIEVEVQNLALFFDWDNDGTAGNETLKEGESITLETRLLEVPYSGGTYTVKIDAPIEVFLESQIVSPETPGDNFTFNVDLYKGYPNLNLSYVADIKNNVLSVRIEPSNSRNQRNKSIYLYDFMGHVLDTISIKQEGNPSAEIPQLGENGCQAVAAMASDLAKALSSYNVIEQLYHYNKDVLAYQPVGLIDNRLLPSDGGIEDMWEAFYKANNRNLQIQDYDASALGVYSEILDVFSAMIYYNMVLAWGDVPYVLDYDEIMSGNFYFTRTDQNEILDDLTQKLTAAIDVLEDKKNESLDIKTTDDMNKFFFVSKDVARILLSNIYMYRGKYAEAKALLLDVIEAGFYTLDASNYSSIETIERLSSERTSSELIFALDASSGTRSTRATDIVIRQPLLVPLMTYTDVLLSYAECLYHEGSKDDAGKYLRQVADAKGIVVSDDLFDGIKDARRQLLLYSIGNFAFYKRNGIAVEELAIKEYQQLLPIPQSELDYNPNMTQNEGFY